MLDLHYVCAQKKSASTDDLFDMAEFEPLSNQVVCINPFLITASKLEFCIRMCMLQLLLKKKRNSITDHRVS